jgi:L,D-transpeptidase YcbB
VIVGLNTPVAFAAAAASDTGDVKMQPPSVTEEIQEQARGRLKKFYARRNFTPLWATNSRIGPEADALLELLMTSSLDGLKPSSYKIDKLRDALVAAQAQDAKSVAHAELALSDAFSRYVGDLRGVSKLKKMYPGTELKQQKLKADAILAAATLPRSLKDYVASMGWMNPHYVQLRTLLGTAKARGAPDDVVRRLRLNLDRARVLPGPWTHNVVIDAASGRLWYYQAGKQELTMRVVIGKPESPTPMLAGTLQYAILNPYWNVPTDLVQTLIAPKVLAGKSLADMGLEALSDWSLTPAKLDPASINWQAVVSGRQELRVRQLPGASNSMGRVKFMFPNKQGIYLHDTPERELLTKEDRHFSNGCIRLEDAEKLGMWLLGISVRSAVKDPEQIVALPAPVPVYLTYFSAIETKQGLEFREDVYGLDR